MASIIARRCFRVAQPLGSFGSRFGSRSLSVAIGDAVPNVSLDQGFPPAKVPLADYCKGKKVVLVGLPGAFTPT